MSDECDGRMDRVHVRVPEQVLADTDRAVQDGLYPNRSAAVVDALREKFSEFPKHASVTTVESDDDRPPRLFDSFRGDD